jgi:hypothetical protein
LVVEIEDGALADVDKETDVFAASGILLEHDNGSGG